MQLHYATNRADWEAVPEPSRNRWQRLAARSHGVATPGNAVSLVGIVLVLAGLIIVSIENFWQGIGLILVGRVADILDGTIAARTGTKGPVGEVVDATFDKLAAIVVLAVFVALHWIPTVPVLCIALHVTTNSALAVTARVRRVELHSGAVGKFATVGAWAILLMFPVARVADHLDLGTLYAGAMVVAYVLTIVFVGLAAKAILEYYQQATVHLRRPILATVVCAVTGFRIVCAAAIIVLAVSNHWLAVLVLTFLAFASDFLDGRLARRWNVVSTFGMTFDPLADKVVCLTLLAIAAAYVSPWYWLMFGLFGAYDVLTMTLRFVLPRPMPASKIAKLKTALLMIGLVAMVLGVQVTAFTWFAAVLLLAAAVLTLQSLIGYTRAIGRSFEWLEHAPGVAVIDFAAWHKQYGVRAVLFDIEGTLTPWADHRVDEVIALALKRARKAGIEHYGLVSNMNARHVARAAKVAEQINATTYHVPLARGERKPSPAMLRIALAKLEIPPEAAGFVGDKLVDVLAAHRAGAARVAWVSRLGSADHPLDRFLYRPAERLLKWLIR